MLKISYQIVKTIEKLQITAKEYISGKLNI